MNEKNMKISATISGSFNKYFNQIRQKILEFEREGIEVLSPKPSMPICAKDDFVLLESDEGLPQEIELKHLDAISRSDFLYIINPEGYIGKSVALEIGYALTRNIPIYSLEEPKDYLFSFFVKPEKSIQAIKRSIATTQNRVLPVKPLTLTELQEYVRRIVKERGFEKESITDVLILFVEEVGELSRAIRNLTGLGVDLQHTDSYKSLGEELADCLIYILDLANLAGINLEHALREKEEINLMRKWHSRKG